MALGRSLLLDGARIVPRTEETEVDLMAATAHEGLRGQHPNTTTDAALITVIEDEAIVLVGYQMLFESWGYSVVAASSAVEALAALRECGRAPDVIIADYRLREGQTGVAAIRMVQERFGQQIPAILVTGDTGAERLREAASSGLPILHKPVNGGQLRELLVRCLS